MRLLQMLLASVALSSAAFLPGSLPRRSAVSSHTPRVAAVAMNGDYYSRLGVQRNADEFRKLPLFPLCARRTVVLA